MNSSSGTGDQGKWQQLLDSSPELRDLLHKYDLRHYAEAMQRLIRRLPTLGPTENSPADQVVLAPIGEMAIAAEAGRQAAHELLTQAAHEVLAQAAQRITAAVPEQPLGLVAPGGLPRVATLVGREAELEQLLAALRSGSGPVGVFAVEGLGGVGKTALAAEAVVRLALDPAAFPGGAVWLSCEGLGGPGGLAEVWSRVARALNADQVAALPDPEQRRAALRATLSDPNRPRLLLALDNVEPDLDPDALLDTLAGGQAVLLLTARHAIAPRRLTTLQLHPLADPAAIALFTQCLRQVDPARPMPEDAPAIARLVTLVGGLPLAIELAAAYAGVQRTPLADLAAEVEREGLAAGALYDPKHGVSLRFDRSWRVLSEAQRRLMAGLALLEGATFPRAAALALIPAARDGLPAPAGPDAPVSTPEAAELDALVALALIEPQPHNRLRLHPLLREYAAARLAALDPTTANRLGNAALAYWLAYARAHQYRPGRDIANLDALDAEAAGLMGALTWAQAHSRHHEVVALARALSLAWDIRGRRAEELWIYRWAVRAAQQLGDRAEERWAIHELAATDAQVGQIAEARAGFEQALALARELGDLRAELDELHALAILDARTGQLDEARAGYERALRLALELGDPAAEQREVHQLALLDAWKGRLAEARAGFERALVLARQLGDPRAEQAGLHELAVLDHQTGRLAEARAGHEHALALARQLGDPAAEQEEIHALALLDSQTGRLAEARAGYERALALARQLGDPTAEAAELRNLGSFLGEHGDAVSGRPLIEESLVISERLGDRYSIGKCHHYLGKLDAEAGDREGALAHYQEALRLFERIQAPEADEVRADLRRLGVMH